MKVNGNVFFACLPGSGVSKVNLMCFFLDHHKTERHELLNTQIIK